MTKFRTNVISGSVTMLFNVALNTVCYSVYINKLGYEKYGLWLILSTILTFVQLGNLGLMPVIIKIVAQEYELKNFKSIIKYVTTALYSLIFSGAILVLLLIFSKGLVVDAFKLNNANAEIISNLLPFMAVFSVYIFLVQVYTSTLSGLGYMNISNYVESMGRFIALIVAVILIDNGMGIYGLFWGTITSYLIVHIVITIIIRKKLGKVSFIKISDLDSGCLKKLLSLSYGVFGGSIVVMLVNPFNKLILSRLAGPSAVSVYEISFNASMQLRALFESAFKSIIPEISRCKTLLDENKLNYIDFIVKQSNRLIKYIAIPVWLFAIILSDYILDIWLINNIDNSLYLSFKVMLVAIFISLLGVPYYYILIGLGETNKVFISNIIQSVICFTLVLCIIKINNYITVPFIGAVMCLSILMSTCYLYINFKKCYNTLKNQIT